MGPPRKISPSQKGYLFFSLSLSNGECQRLCNIHTDCLNPADKKRLRSSFVLLSLATHFRASTTEPERFTRWDARPTGQ